MNLTVNRAYLAAGLRAARRYQRLGILFIVVTMAATLGVFLSDQYWLVIFAYPTLFIGFPLRQYGGSKLRGWKEAAAVPELLMDEIRPGPKQQVYSFVPIGDVIIDHLLVGPEGLLVFEMRGLTEDKKGRYEVTCRQKNDQDRWSQRLPIFERFIRIGEPALGNPSAALDGKIAALKSWLAERNLGQAPVRGVIVFRQGATPLNIEACHYEVLHLNEVHSFLSLGQYFDENMRLTVLSGDERNRLNAALRGAMGVEAAVPIPAKAPARKLSPAAQAEQERVRAIRAARTTGPGGAKPAPPGPRKGPG